MAMDQAVLSELRDGQNVQPDLLVCVQRKWNCREQRCQSRLCVRVYMGLRACVCVYSHYSNAYLHVSVVEWGSSPQCRELPQASL